MRVKPIRFVGHEIGPFDHIELNWKGDSRYTLISAQNGMGKTTLVNAISYCLLNAAQTQVTPNQEYERIYRTAHGYTYLEISVREKVLKVLQFSRNQSPSKGLRQFKEQALLQFFDEQRQSWEKSETILGKKSENVSASWGNSHSVMELAAAYGVRRELVSQSVEGYEDVKTNPLDNILSPSASVESKDILQWIANQLINRVLALAEGKNDEAENYSHTIQRVEKFFSRSLGIDIKFEMLRNPLRLHVQAQGVSLDVDQLSHGTRSLLSWLLDYLQRASRVSWKNPKDATIAPGIIVIDEIDMHLHPAWQRKVMGAIADLLPETHIIATTHSPFVLAGAEDAQIFEIFEDDDHKLAVRSYDDLYGYPADLMLKTAFGMESLYPPEIERKMARLARLENKLISGTISAEETDKHHSLLNELANVNPWLESLIAMQYAHD